MSHIEEGIDIPVKLLWDMAVKLVLCQTPRRTSINRAVPAEQHDPAWRAEARRQARAEDGRISIDELCASPETTPTRFDDRFVRLYTVEDLQRVTQLLIDLTDTSDVQSAVIACQFGRPIYVPTVIAVTAHTYP
ncbi:hypothetical protein Q9295_02460 [Xinfangfangia sp. CPCC 101601]|uniref:Uncharacterized protein n=1 Tax=Pseudogemmobacter lacusdianii TaxID=3069608 RepID=A0ABU0VU35_9RHOB|nr:hypothetical protein [Xinfangfangia sp. CPCC 101601]MDQ2065223.1 hypothetical protein [Xinfangfangia sp. CPCC 101601]